MADLSDSRQADIEITPEMIEAGVTALCETGLLTREVEQRSLALREAVGEVLASAFCAER